MIPNINTDKRNKIYLLLWFFITIFIGGYLYGIGFIYNEHHSFSFLYTCAVGVGPFMWCWIDARGQGEFLGFGWMLSIVFVPIIAIPIYFFYYKGIKTGSIYFLKLLGLFIVSVVFYGLGVETYNITNT